MQMHVLVPVLYTTIIVINIIISISYIYIILLVGRARAWFSVFDNNECSVCNI